MFFSAHPYVYIFVYVCVYFSPQGTPERLIMHLVEEPSVVDPTYIEDFLLTYRTFLSSPMEVGKKLLEWFQMDSLRDTVSVCVCACMYDYLVAGGHFLAHLQISI